MRRTGFAAMGSPLGGTALGIGFLAQAQSRPFVIPVWLFLLLALAVIIFGVIWVLYEEKEKAPKEEELPAAPEVAPAILTAEVSPPPVKPDDLKLIEGIGPKISGLLQAAGISTFAQLAEADVDRLSQILTDAGITGVADPATWPEQARLAAGSEWDALEALQDRLKGGRRV